MDSPSLSTDEIINMYRKRAKRYDFTANLYYLIGFREWAVRKQAIDALNLQPGDTVVEIGCGTGLNFGLLQEAVGPTGRIIGVDLTDAMLEQARQRIAEQGWTNVELGQADAAQYEFSPGVNGILSTFAITLVPEYEQVIAHGSQALAPGGRLVVADFKLTDNRLLQVLTPLLLLATRPFGVRLAMADRHPWEAIEKYLDQTFMRERYLGYAYVAGGERTADN